MKSSIYAGRGWLPGALILGLIAVWLVPSSAQGGFRPPMEPAAPPPSASVGELIKKITALVGQKKLDEARTAADLAVAAARAAGDRPGEALALAQRAPLLEAQSRHAEAIADWDATASAWAAAGDGPGQVRALLSVALLLTQTGKANDARDRLDRAVAVGRQEVRRSFALGVELLRGAQPFLTRGLLRETEQIYRLCLEIFDRVIPDSAGVAAVLDGLGNVVSERGGLREARAHHERSLAISIRLEPDSYGVASSLNNLGSLAFDEGDVLGAASYYERSLSLLRKLSGTMGNRDYSYDIAGLQVNLGDLMRQQGDLEAARMWLDRAMELLEQRFAGSEFHANCMINLGNVVWRRGDLDGAMELYRKALALQRQRAPGSIRVASILANIGNILAAQGAVVEAGAHYREALAIEEKVAPRSLQVAVTLESLGNLAANVGQQDLATSYYERALSINQEQAPDSLPVSASLNNLGIQARIRGDSAAARRYCEGSLAIREKLAPGSLELAASLNNLGNVLRDQGDRQGALRRFTRAWNVVRSQATQVTGDEAQRRFGASYLHYAASLQQALLVEGQRNAAIQVLEQSRAQALLQTLSTQGLYRLATPEARARYVGELNAESIARREHMRAAEGARAAAAAVEAASGRPDAERALLGQSLKDALEQERQAREAVVEQRRKTETALARVRAATRGGALGEPLPFEKARLALKPGELFLAYALGEFESTLYLVERSVPVVALRLPSAERTLNQAIGRVRGGLARPDRPAPKADLKALAGMLLPAAAVARIKAARRVLLSPDGSLWLSPFAALPLTGTARPLGLEKPLLMVQSLGVYARTQLVPRETTSLQALALGGCVYGNAPATAAGAPTGRGKGAGLRETARELPPLPASKGEATAVAALFGGKALTGSGANEAALRRLMGSARIIHLATHGRYFEGDTLLSGVVLSASAAGVSAHPDADGVFEAAELLDPAVRSRAELVVLSACETARGRREHGEGLVGLSRCWQIAGARSVVASQWSVADQSTAELMVAFHRGLKTGLAKDEALRRAMATSARRNPHPFYWAPFILIGDPAPLPRRH